ncbi:hypothetical protein P170DRAFT_221441 [Aspergillus steynii IBT 23096]|uniref:Uncharacterized protein n=1 Tax=Aspergillus steynii IBT 23096 TaxID=1392250 RepID=A0A2I2G1J8_9EURO|nr:uncharacterized protein P170DRAFT_221441 [Aspergillus steynii IBT 23096]PLB46749.1 hypothetical protein P170DRAFT_221441 [Aspergillus steynii IBT 23096]
MHPTNSGKRSYPISSYSRSKLSAFRYTSKDGADPAKSPTKTPSKKEHANKENQSSWLNGVVVPPALDESKEESSLGAAESKPVKECPQTPGNRIPLADLIGNAEDAITQAPGPQFTPEDYVTWQHVPASSNQDPMSQTPAIKGRKRCHSSSPTSSPLAGNSKNARKGSFDLQAYQGLIKTPQHDLATELWNNYVGKMGANGNKELPPRLPNLPSSSPQTPASLRAGRDSSGLRRSTSCLAEWPNSAAKRRRVDGEKLGTGRGIFSRTKSSLADSSSFNPSKINFLVQKIERSLRDTPAAQPDPLGSSPIPASKRGQRDRSVSPVVSNKAPQHTTQSIPENGDQLVPQPQSRETVQKSSSDFGDDDLDDDDFFGLAQASMDPFVEPSQHGTGIGTMNPEYAGTSAPVNQQKPPDMQCTYHSITMESAPASNIDNKTEYTLDADEFDDDFDEFSDNIEDILAECDATQNTKLARPAAKNYLASNHSGSSMKIDKPVPPVEPVNGTSKPVEASSGDEFDDEDFDMDAIEQSMMQSGEKGSNHVCHS